MARDAIPIIAVAVLLAACGAQPSPSDAGAPSMAASVVPTPESSASPSATETPTPASTPEMLGRDFAGLAFIRDAAPDGAGPAQVFVVGADGLARQITSYAWDADFGGANAVRWSPDGTRLAVGVGNPHGVRTDVMDADGSSVVEMRGGWSMEWSPDGTRLVLAETVDVVPPGYSPGVWVLDPSNGSEIQVGTGYFPHWYDDESVTAYRAVGETESHPGEPTVFLHQADGTGDETVLITEQREVVRSTASGRRALVSENGPCGAPCSRLALPEGDAVWTIDGASAPSWSPDGDTVAYLVGAAPNVGLYNYSTGERTLGARASRVTWAPDGQRLVLEVQDAKVVVIDAATGEELLAVSGRSASWVATR
jgi:Tol biopolymer transport system component